MQVNPKAGKPAVPSDLVNIPKLITAYFTEHPDPSIREQRVSFGTSGHRGSALRVSSTRTTSWRSARRFASIASKKK